MIDFKKYIGTASGVLTLIGTIAAGVIYVNTNYAQAEDVKQILNNQDKQIRLYSQAQRDNKVFQLEYYDDRLKKLTEERNRAMMQRNTPMAQRSVTRSPEEIQVDIEDTRKRRELVRESIVTER